MVENHVTKFPSHIFVTGTDTGIGKSVISAILMTGLNAAYWKPIQSGLDGSTDTEWVQEKTVLPKGRFIAETYRLGLPLSPHASAEHDGIRIDLGAFNIPEIKDADNLIIEGAGGLMVPLNERVLMSDLIARLDVPVLMVASNSLGTINHTLLSLEHLKGRGIDVVGVVLNGQKNPINRKAIEHYGGVRIIGEIEHMPHINPVTLMDCFKKCFL